MQNLILEIVQRDSKTYTITLTRNHIAEDISGWTLKFTVKKNFNDHDVDALIMKSSVLPNDINSQNGKCFITLTSVDTDLPNDVYFYDIKLIDGADVTTFARGDFVIIPSMLEV